MQIGRRALYVLILIVSFAMLSLPVFADQVIATVQAGIEPDSAAVNPVTNKIYVTNVCGNDPNCSSVGTVTVIDGTTNNPISVNVGAAPHSAAVNPATNMIYVANFCGNDVTCTTLSGTVSVIDGASNTVVATVTVGSGPSYAAVNSATNKIYVANICGNDVTCSTYSGTVTVIDGTTLTTATINVGADPYAPVVNAITNKIYVPNGCGTDPTCGIPHSGGTVTVIDGATNNPVSVNVGVWPWGLDVNAITNKIYVANHCGDDPNCASTATMTVIDGATLATTEVAIGGSHPRALAVNSVTNKIYVPSLCNGDPSCQGEPIGTVSVVDGGTLTYTSVPAGERPYAMALNSVTNKIYVANGCGNDPSCGTYSGTLTVVDGVTLATETLNVGAYPYAAAANSETNRIYVPNFCGNDPSCQTYNGTVSVVAGIPPTPLQFAPVTPCRVVDTRNANGTFGGPPIQSGTYRSFPIPQGSCDIPTTAAAYSLNVTVVPSGPLGYLTIWPTGQGQPVVSTMNSLDGRIKANAAIVPAGTQGAVSVYVTNRTNVVLDIDGYFAPTSDSTLAFYPLTPCRVLDTRNANGDLGGPFLASGQERDFPVLESTCNIPNTAQAYSMNFTVVPYQGQSLGYLTVWPQGGLQPKVSTLNNLTATIVANAAIVPAGTGGGIATYPSGNTQLVADIDGYFAPAGTGGLSLYPTAPCRVIDTRKIGNGQPFSGTLSPPVDVVDSVCAPPSTAQAYVFNATVVPTGGLGYLTLWPDGEKQPVVSTLNAIDGAITSNMAIVPNVNGSIDAYASGITQLILDISSYFAP